MYYPIATILQNLNKWTFTCAHFGPEISYTAFYHLKYSHGPFFIARISRALTYISFISQYSQAISSQRCAKADLFYHHILVSIFIFNISFGKRNKTGGGNLWFPPAPPSYTYMTSRCSILFYYTFVLVSYITCGSLRSPLVLYNHLHPKPKTERIKPRFIATAASQPAMSRLE